MSSKTWFQPQTDDDRALVRAWLEGLTTSDRAQLRRSSTPPAVAFIPAFHRLRWQIADSQKKADWDALGVGAILAASVSSTGHRAPVAAFGRQNGDRPALSELRLQRLARTRSTPGDTLAEFRRAAAVVDGEISPTGLFALVYAWCVPALHANAQRHLLFGYYDTTQQAET